MFTVVTGAFGYIGKYIARNLLARGEEVRTITTHPDKPNPFGAQVQAFPYEFNRPQILTNHLHGARMLYNTYWIRFEYGGATYEQALQNTATLFTCAKEAGIEKIVHISVTNPSLEDDLPYYAGKARQEELLKASGVPYTIVRPTLVFGVEDILVNNIAWLIRRFPVFPIFGDGQYRLRPVFVADLAQIAVAAARTHQSQTLDAVGPEEYTFEAFVKLIAGKLKPDLRLIRNVPPALGIALGQLISLTTRDILLTGPELRGLMEEKLTSNQQPNGSTRFSLWLGENADQIGTSYTSELVRHFHWENQDHGH